MQENSGIREFLGFSWNGQVFRDIEKVGGVHFSILKTNKRTDSEFILSYKTGWRLSKVAYICLQSYENMKFIYVYKVMKIWNGDFEENITWFELRNQNVQAKEVHFQLPNKAH